jgi:release factor glutamine methyltransferase
LAKNKPNWSFTAVDINQKALKTARMNAVFYQLRNIKFVQSDLFSNIRKEEKFNIIVANPPYLSDGEYGNISLMAREQPKEALVAKNDGYFFYREIFTKVRVFL